MNRVCGAEQDEVFKWKWTDRVWASSRPWNGEGLGLIVTLACPWTDCERGVNKSADTDKAPTETRLLPG